MVVEAKSAHGKLFYSQEELHRAPAIDSDEVLEHIYGWGYRQLQKQVAKRGRFASATARAAALPPLQPVKWPFGRALRAPGEVPVTRKRRAEGEPIAFVPASATDVPAWDSRARFGLTHDERMTRVCTTSHQVARLSSSSSSSGSSSSSSSRSSLTQCQVQHTLHMNRAVPDVLTVRALTVGCWNSGPPRGNIGGMEAFRASFNHVVICQEFDDELQAQPPAEADTDPEPAYHSGTGGWGVRRPRHWWNPCWRWSQGWADPADEPPPPPAQPTTLQAQSLINTGFAIAGSAGGCTIGVREHLLESAEVVWSDVRDRYIYAVIVRCTLKAQLAGLDTLVVGSVHLNNQRVSKPMAAQLLIDTWLAVSILRSSSNRR